MTGPLLPPPAPQADFVAPPAATATRAPGRGLIIAALVFAFVLAPAGFVLSIVAVIQSGSPGGRRGMAIAALIISVVMMVLSLVLGFLLIQAGIALAEQGAASGSNWLIDQIILWTGAQR